MELTDQGGVGLLEAGFAGAGRPWLGRGTRDSGNRRGFSVLSGAGPSGVVAEAGAVGSPGPRLRLRALNLLTTQTACTGIDTGIGSRGGSVGEGCSAALSELLSRYSSRHWAGRGFEDASCVISSISVTSDHD